MFSISFFERIVSWEHCGYKAYYRKQERDRQQEAFLC